MVLVILTESYSGIKQSSGLYIVKVPVILITQLGFGKFKSNTLTLVSKYTSYMYEVYCGLSQNGTCNPNRVILWY